MGMLSSELSSYVLWIPDDAYTTLKFFWLFHTQSDGLQADWLISESNDKETLNIDYALFEVI